MFVAIRGERHDGHDFIDPVLSAGVKGMVIDRQKAKAVFTNAHVPTNVLVIGVTDTTQALGDLAAYHRRRAGIVLTAVTGSNGKTSVREMMAAVFRQKFTTLATMGNFNNHIGLPLTLLRLDRSHQAAVVEMGMNHPGELRRLSEIGRPDLAVITNIGAAHLEGLGTLETVMHAKAEIMAGMAHDAPLIVNGDDAYCRKLAATAARPVVFFGTGKNAHARAADIQTSAAGSRFTLHLADHRTDIKLNVPGLFMVSNALAAAAAGDLMGVSLEEIKAGLESFTPVRGRMNIVKTVWGGTIIDDTYNANPDSMAAAIRTLVALKGSGRAVVAAGDMLELGEHAADYHHDIGRLCADLDVDRVYAVGQYAGAVADGARKAGMPARSVVTGEKNHVTADLAAYASAGDWILVKGSRSMEMETVVRFLKEEKKANKINDNKGPGQTRAHGGS